MVFNYNDKTYDVVIDKKPTNKNTYIRVKKDMTIYVTTNYFTRDKEIKKLLNMENVNIVIENMILYMLIIVI